MDIRTRETSAFLRRRLLICASGHRSLAHEVVVRACAVPQRQVGVCVQFKASFFGPVGLRRTLYCRDML